MRFLFPGGVLRLVFLLSHFLLSALAEKPVLEDLFPAGAGQGSTNVITLGGKFEPWPPRFWIEGEGIKHSFTTNKGKVELLVSPEAAPGPRLVRIYNKEGASEARIFVIGGIPEAGESEPNDHFSKAQRLEKLPVTVNGRLEKRGDVDSFLVHLQQGESLEVGMENYVLMGKIDGVLRLLDTRGAQLAWNHDFATLDPRLTWRAATEQDVVLQVFGFAYPANSQIELAGGEGGSYRLHFSKGSTLGGEATPHGCEQEPNDSPAQSQVLELPARVSGTIGQGLDEDRFSFSAEKDRFYLVEVDAMKRGSPLDPWLKIEDVNGKEVARNDDAEGTVDPKLEWKAPESARYSLAVGSVTHRGGEAFRYTIQVVQGEPDYQATVESGAIFLKAGETNEVKLKVAFLRGFTNALEAVFKDIPEGVTCDPVKITAAGDVSLKLVAASAAGAANQPCRLMVRDTITGQERPVEFEFTSRSINNGVPGGYSSLLIESTDQIWLTVAETPAEKPEIEKEKADSGP